MNLIQAAAIPPKVQALVDEIIKLNLIEVSFLTKELKEKLGLSDASMGIGVAAAPAAGGAPAAAAAAAPAAEVKKAQTEFSVKLVSFDAAAKIKVIKEVRAITELGLKEVR